MCTFFIKFGTRWRFMSMGVCFVFKLLVGQDNFIVGGGGTRANYKNAKFNFYRIFSVAEPTFTLSPRCSLSRKHE